MTKNEQKSYMRKIDEVTDGLLIEAYRVALGEVDRIHRDILYSLKLKIDAWFKEHPEKEEVE